MSNKAKSVGGTSSNAGSGLLGGFAPSGEQAGRSNFKNKLRALVVDDSRLSRMLLTAMLRSLRVECSEVVNGREAVDLFQQGKESFHVVFMDKEMPIMDGIEATRNLRSMGAAVTIAGLTSITTEEEKQKFLDAGIDTFFVKPISRAQLLALLREVDGKL